MVCLAGIFADVGVILFARQGVQSGQHSGGLVVAYLKTGIQQAEGFNAADLRIGRAHDNGQKAFVALERRKNQIVARGVDPAGFKAVRARVLPKKGIFVPGDAAPVVQHMGVMETQRIGVGMQIGAGKGQHVACGGVLPLGRETVRIDKVTVAHAQIAGLGVHHVDERGHGAAHIFGHGRAGVVAGRNSHARKELVKRNLLVLVEAHARAAGAGRIAADRSGIVNAGQAGVDLIHGKKHGHDLGQRGRGNALVGILLKQYGVAVKVVQNG